MATGFGLRPIRHMNGAPYRGECHRYYVPSTDSSDIGIGECVKVVAAMDAAGLTNVCAQAAAGDAILGVVVGIEPNANISLSKRYRPASTAAYVLVCDDPSVVYEVQEDAVGNVVTAAHVGEHYNADIVVVSATANVTTATGLSKTMLDSSDGKAATAQLKIVGVVRDSSTNAAALAAGARLEVVIHEHAMTVDDSIV